LIVCGQQLEIGRRVVTWLEPGAPNFYQASMEVGQELYSVREGMQPNSTDLASLAAVVDKIVLHHDGTWNSRDCFLVLKERRLSTNLMIDTDGTIYQAMDLRERAFATGGLFNSRGIGIDMNTPATVDHFNNGELGRQQLALRGGFITGTVHGGKVTSSGYTEEQYLSLIAVILGVHKLMPKIRLFPPLDATGNVIWTKIENALTFTGFMGHFHCDTNKWDPGPGFDWQRVMIGLHGERNSMPVDLPQVPNLSKVYNVGELRIVAEKYYINVESGGSGYYPISTSQAWHSGVNLHVPLGTPVRCMASGKIIAVRNVQDTELGSPSFVLVRHTIRSEPKEVKVEEGKEGGGPKDPKAKETFVEQHWFSLYMHLNFIPEDTPEEKRPAWYKFLSPTEAGGLAEPPPASLDGDQDGDRRPRVGKPNFASLRGGRIVLLDLEVAAGEILGYIGTFGVSEEFQEPMVHVEAFSADEDPLFDPTQFPDRWRLVEADEGNDSLADIGEIWRPILEETDLLGEEARVRELGRRILAPSEIKEFFQSTAIKKELFRTYVCRHVSEWSDSLNWAQTAPIAVGWKWQTQEAYQAFLDRWAPFMWLNNEVAEHAKINQQRLIWTYHPVTLLTWLHENYGRQLSPEEFQTGLSNEALREEAEKDRQRALLEEAGGLHGNPKEGDAGQLQVDTSDPGLFLQLDDDLWKDWEQGEWPLEKDL
jgi:N-acetyl-anhydromuramyl-L-alanine amidase AmpD